ncbi:CehA/McbA family metallohydrolase [Candidatus Hydrogenedentota bacterium]
MPVAPGEVNFSFTKGFEYLAHSVTLELREGERIKKTIKLKRWANMPAKGYYSGDTHIHANYFQAPDYVKPADVLLRMKGEDLNVGNIMVANANVDHLHDKEYFEGHPNSVSEDNYIVYYNEEHRNQGFYGHLCLIDLKSLVEPLHTGWVVTSSPADYPHLAAIERKTRAQNGFISYAHPTNTGKSIKEKNDFKKWAEEMSKSPHGCAAMEMPIDLAFGLVDSMDIMSYASKTPLTVELWQALLNCGFRLPGAAGTDCFLNHGINAAILGTGRVYVKTGDKLTYRDWVDELRAGRCFVTNGPMVEFDLGGSEPGDAIDLSSGESRNVTVTITGSSQYPLDSIQLVRNGEVIAETSLQGAKDGKLKEKITLTGPGWYQALVSGGRQDDVAMGSLFAATSPIYVTQNGRRYVSKEYAELFARWTKNMTDTVSKRARFDNEKDKAEVIGDFENAAKFYNKMAATGEWPGIIK